MSSFFTYPSKVLLASLLLIQSSSGFTVSLGNRPTHVRTQLLMVSNSIPPPPSLPSPSTVEQIKVSPATVTSPITSTSNLPSQKQLAEKAQTVSVPSAPTKSTNVASGTGIVITDIHYDGDVPKTESDEYVVLSNLSNSPVDISGYYIYVATTGTQGPTFTFPKGTIIKPGTSFRVYTNEIHKETGGYSFGSGKAIWSNNGGLAVIKDSNGKKLGEYKYKPTQ